MSFSENNKKLKILFVASEAAPFARIGGLGSVMYSLPRALRAIGHDARMFMPRYLSVDPRLYRLKTECEHLEVIQEYFPERVKAVYYIP